jgi:hypothetical protein
MTVYTRRPKILDLRRLSYSLSSAGAEFQAGADRREVVLLSSEKDADIPRGLTLDDFGGRSDALGG